MVTVTDKAVEKIKTLLADQDGGESAASGLRVGVRGGGCSGFEYSLAFDEQRDDDQVFEANGVKVLIDSMSLTFVDGSEVDYVESLQGAGFAVNNPNVVAACGCGQSFKVKDDAEPTAV